MDSASIIFSIIILAGLIYILYIIFRDPILMIKSFFRRLKAEDLKLRILFFPIWGTIWLIDYIFKLNIYFNEIEETSRPLKINFQDYEKYILINSHNNNYLRSIINDFKKEYDPNEYNFSLEHSELLKTVYKNNILLKINGDIQFNSFFAFIHFIDNSAPKDQVYNIKGVLIDKTNLNNSFFVFFNIDYLLKLIGKTKNNRKIYVEPFTGKNSDTIFFNSNLEYIENFRFNRFIQDIDHIRFDKIN